MLTYGSDRRKRDIICIVKEWWKNRCEEDNGSSCPRTIVQRYLVPQEKFQEGKALTIRCTHGDTTLCPLADIEMEVKDVPI